MSFGATDELLLRGVGAARDGEREDARFYLEWTLRDDPTVAQFAEAWYWLSRIAPDDAERRHCLGQVLGAEPLHAEARRDLAILDGRLRPEAIIDPDTPLAPFTPDARIPAGTTQLSRCPSCGGALLFEPPSGGLRCQFCGYRVGSGAAAPGTAPSSPRERDWAAAIYTKRGHRWVLPGERMLTCTACGASRTLPDGVVGGICPFCGSAQIVAERQGDELLTPDGIAPFGVDAAGARVVALARLAHEFGGGDAPRLVAVEPIYRPWWTFDIEGLIRWRGFVEGRYGRVPHSGENQSFHDDVLVPAGVALPGDDDVALAWDLSAVVAFEPSWLAGWPAEVYRVPLAAASLRARERVLRDERERIALAAPSELHDLAATSVDLAVVSYKLLLLPTWIATYRQNSTNTQHCFAFSGQASINTNEDNRGDTLIDRALS